MPEHKKIFIAGCGRSGTRLMRQLTACFDDVYIQNTEQPVEFFQKLAKRPEKNIVIKRAPDSYLTLDELASDVLLLYMVRHPFDTLTSSHHRSAPKRRFHITKKRWIGEYRAYKKLREKQPDRPTFVVRYEDLISQPDAMQEKIVQHFGLVARHKFTENQLGVAIHSDSLQKWRASQEFRDYLVGLDADWMRQIEEFCRTFGYEIAEEFRAARVAASR